MSTNGQLQDAMHAVDRASESLAAVQDAVTTYGVKHATASTPAQAIRDRGQNIIDQLRNAVSAMQAEAKKFEEDAESLIKDIESWINAHAENMQLYTDTAKALGDLIKPIVHSKERAT